MIEVPWFAPIACLFGLTLIWTINTLIISIQYEHWHLPFYWGIAYIVTVIFISMNFCDSQRPRIYHMILPLGTLLTLFIGWLDYHNWPQYQVVFFALCTFAAVISIINVLVFFACKKFMLANFQRDMIPRLLNSQEETEPEECSICFEMTDRHPSMWPECQHKFHAECINKWITYQAKCPNCRKEMV